jgi:glycosyltransferase involved in cell wall biosynthesis
VTGGLHLLVYGDMDSGVSAQLRVGLYRQPLSALGIEVRGWSGFADDVLSGVAPSVSTASEARAGERPDAAALRDIGLTAIAWADVILFRRFHSTHSVCTECEAVFAGPEEHERHLAASGHYSVPTDRLFRAIVGLIAARPDVLGGRALVYETDDDLLNCPDWTGLGPTARRERDLVKTLLGLADLVITTTPVLARRLAGAAGAPVRVIRNALEPAWYSASEPDGPVDAPGGPRVVYHGVPVRLRDYEIARPAVDAAAGEFPDLRRVWLGAANEPLVVAAVDEVRPWVDGSAEFAAALVGARPDIGLAPLRDEPFNRAKSELHWLEYSMAGAATIVSGFEGGGPYDVVRDGVDGLVARSSADWRRHLRSLAGSRELRAEIAGRARERVLADYSVLTRAPEWADAYKWAADHAGIGRSRITAAAARHDLRK